MRLLVVGLGSMGKRRVRNLLALGQAEVAGFDVRADRREEAAARYGVTVFEKFSSAVEHFRPDALVVSTPPDVHMLYAREAQERRLPCFLEASVTGADEILSLHDRAAAERVVIVPSCTMSYFPGPRKVAELVHREVVGKVLTINYHVGQYLPDWHPWERIQDYYVSRRETGGCREIVPFELTWLNDLFGSPEPLAAVRGKVSSLDADIDDVYHCLLRYPGGALANLTIEVLSRPRATRELRIVGSDGLITWSGDSQSVRWIGSQLAEWQEFPLARGTVEEAYINPEEPYQQEMADFCAAVAAGDPSLFPNTLARDAEVLRLLERLERLSGAAS